MIFFTQTDLKHTIVWWRVRSPILVLLLHGKKNFMWMCGPALVICQVSFCYIFIRWVKGGTLIFHFCSVVCHHTPKQFIQHWINSNVTLNHLYTHIWFWSLPLCMVRKNVELQVLLSPSLLNKWLWIAWGMLNGLLKNEWCSNLQGQQLVHTLPTKLVEYLIRHFHEEGTRQHYWMFWVLEDRRLTWKGYILRSILWIKWTHYVEVLVDSTYQTKCTIKK